MAEWDTKPAYVVMPATEEGALRKKYDAQVELWGKVRESMNATRFSRKINEHDWASSWAKYLLRPK